MRVFLAFLFVAVIATPSAKTPVAQSNSPANSRSVESMEHNLQRIESNGAAAHPDPTPTEFTEQEINAYFAAGKVKLPVGVQSVTFRGQPGVITGTSRVDFDQIRAGQRASNPLLSLFSGVHDVVVVAHASGAGGQGVVNVDSVSLDSMVIPRFVLQLFVEKYLQPKYPNIGLNSRFALSNRIDSAQVGLHTLILTQR
jgi:hypothetical protein